VARFEQALGEYLGVPHLFFASSGRTAFRLLLAALLRRPQLQGRSKVIIPGYTCPAVAKVILDAGLTPQLVDMEPESFTYSAAALSEAVGPDTLAIVVVHPFGIPVAMAPALAAARSVGALVIEDAAQAMGARVEGRHVGTRGHVGLYSLGPGKPLALGGGGVVVTSDDQLAAALAQEWADLPPDSTLQSALAWMRMGLFSLAFQPPVWWVAKRLGAQQVGANEASWGYQMSRFAASQAAVGLAMLPRLDAINAVRREHARQLLAGLAGFTSLLSPGVAKLSRSQVDSIGAQPIEQSKEPIFLRLPLLTSTQAQADSIARALAAAGIGVGRMYGRTIGEFFPQLAGAPMPGSERVARTLLTLPTNHYVQVEDIERIPELIRGALIAD
jgi:dTDP-4-amino-4,6-dideoxygalactose transaminase